MTVCLNCGKSISTVSRECPFCHTPITVNSITNAEAIKDFKHDYDCKDDKLMIISAICFPLGLFYYFTKKSDSPLKSASALGGAFIGIILFAIIVSLIILVNVLS